MSAAVVRYYESCHADFAAWSPALYLHFGLYRPGISPLDRHAMLAAMNDAVIARLALPVGAPSRVLDAGCGVGAVARYLARRHREAEVVGLTIVPSQVTLGRALAAEEGLGDRVRLVHADYASVPLEANGLDAAYAIESLCYAPGDAKDAPIAEMARVLKQGGRFVVADCFRVGGAELPRALRPAYAAMCRGWAIPSLPHLDAVTAALGARGFVDVTVDDVSWRVAPSVAHVPLTVAAYLAGRWRREGRISLDAEQRDNLVAPLLALLVGAYRAHFRYCLVTAVKG